MATTPPRARWRTRLGNVIFDNTTPAGRLFDAALILAIVLSVLFVLLDSVSWLHVPHGALFRRLELVFTLLFTLEYALRLITARHALHYARSPFGVVDALSILPGYLAPWLPGAQFLLVIRVVRLLRIFRVLRLTGFLSAARALTTAIRANLAKITVFVLTMLILAVLTGTAMYALEGPEHGFTSIPTAMYWAIVTLTTVGYGDISPHTPIGKLLASLLMLTGYGIIAVPTGLITAGIVRGNAPLRGGPPCPRCGLTEHVAGARYCQRCGEGLTER